MRADATTNLSMMTRDVKYALLELYQFDGEVTVAIMILGVMRAWFTIQGFSPESIRVELSEDELQGQPYKDAARLAIRRAQSQLPHYVIQARAMYGQRIPERRPRD